MFDVQEGTLDETIKALRNIINNTVKDIDQNINSNYKNSNKSPSSLK